MRKTSLSFNQRPSFWNISLFITFLLMYIPVYWDYFSDATLLESQSYAWLVLFISGYLFWQEKHIFFNPNDTPGCIQKYSVIAQITLFVGIIMYIFGRSQSIPALSVGSQILVILALITQFKGIQTAKHFWFPLFFLVFTIPLPAQILDAITLPLKLAISYTTELILFYADYPIGRNGVILQIGNYQLLVADACAGMKTLVSLEAMGLLYLNLVKHDSWKRNIALGLLIIPISFIANLIRVIILALLTYHFGDHVGQGFMHKFSGLTLFLIALSLIMAIDQFIQKRY